MNGGGREVRTANGQDTPSGHPFQHGPEERQVHFHLCVSGSVRFEGPIFSAASCLRMGQRRRQRNRESGALVLPWHDGFRK